MIKSKTMLFIILFKLLVQIECFAQENFWQTTGGPFAGQIKSLAADTKGNLYAGTTGYGIFKSIDNGITWANSSNGVVNGVVQTMAVNSVGYIFAGTDGNGIFRSTDSGVSWQKINSGIDLDWIYMTSIVVTQSDNIFASCYGGVFRSMDNGDSWVNVLNLGCDALGLTESGHIRASTRCATYKSTDNGNNWFVSDSGLGCAWTCFVAKSNSLFAGISGGGVFKSTDDGSNWTQANIGISDFNVISFAVLSNGNVLAGTRGSGIFRSSNNGASWDYFNNGNSGFIYSLLALPTGTIFLGAHDALYRSTNNGSSWSKVGLPISTINSIFINSQNKIFTGTLISTFISTNHGITWNEAPVNSINSTVNTYAATPSGVIFAGTAGSGIFRSSNEGVTWKNVQGNNGFSWINSLLCIDSTNIFAGTELGLLKSTDLGETWVKNDDDNIFSVAMSPDQKILIGTQSKGIFLSTDQGMSWTQNNSGLTSKPIYSICFLTEDIALAASDSGIFRSTDSGLSWYFSNNGLSNNTVKFLAANGKSFVLAATNSGVFLSTNLGVNWNSFNNGISTNYINTIAFSLDNYAYVGTIGNGVFRSSSPITTVSLKQSNDFPNSFLLFQNYPNPFNPITTISFILSSKSFVSLKIFDALGREVSTLVNEELSVGNQTRQWNASNVVSGVYFYQLKAGSFTETKKLLLLR
jgi:photosystem II stability/assembly factor-like uncharacterized protein